MAEFGKPAQGAKKTRAVSGYLTVARMRQAFHLAPPFGQKEARNEHSELGLWARYGLNAGPDQRALNKTILYPVNGLSTKYGDQREL